MDGQMNTPSILTVVWKLRAAISSLMSLAFKTYYLLCKSYLLVSIYYLLILLFTYMLFTNATYSPIINLFIYLFMWGFTSLSTLVKSRRVVGRAEETSTYSWSRFCTVNCRPMASNYQLSHLRPCREPNPGLRVPIIKTTITCIKHLKKK